MAQAATFSRDVDSVRNVETARRPRLGLIQTVFAEFSRALEAERRYEAKRADARRVFDELYS